MRKSGAGSGLNGSIMKVTLGAAGQLGCMFARIRGIVTDSVMSSPIKGPMHMSPLLCYECQSS